MGDRSETSAPEADGVARPSYARFVDSLVVPASLHDPEGRFLHMNAAAELASGKPNAYWLGRHFTEPVPPGARQKVAAQFRRAVERGEPTDFETVFIDGSGRLRGVRAQQLPLRAGDEIVGVLILAFDARRPPSDSTELEREPQLTARQLEILYLVASGLSTSEISSLLTISTETVRNHVRNVLRELRVHTRRSPPRTARAARAQAGTARRGASPRLIRRPGPREPDLSPRGSRPFWQRSRPGAGCAPPAP
jgi:PAS domain S-box-containing protein